LDKILGCAVVIGATGALGRATSNRLNDMGYRVANIARSFDSEFLDSCKHNLFISCDLGVEEQRSEAWKRICQWTKRLDLLVNCSGVAHGAPAMMTRLSDLRAIFEINYLAVIDFSQRAARLMARSNHGVIIHIASIQACIAQPGNLAYGGSKAALVHSTKVMAAEFGKLGIRVNAIAPTVIKSKMLDLMDDKSKGRLLELSFLGSCLEVDEVVDAVEFLCSSSAKNISGQVIRIDGGMPF